MARGSLLESAELRASGGQAGTRAAIPASTGVGDGMAALAGELRQIGSKVGAMADQAAVREGAEDGKLAGLDPSFRTRGDGTLYGEAFDRAALDIAGTRLRKSLDGELDAIEEKFGDDPNAIAQNFDAVSRKLIAGAPKELQADLIVAAQGKRQVAMRGATRRMIAARVADQKTALSEELTLSLKGVQQQAYGMGLDAAADQAIAAQVELLEKATQRRGVDGKPLVTPAARDKLLASVKREVMDARITGHFERLEGAAAKQAFLAQFEEDFGKSKGVAAEYDLDGFNTMRARLENGLQRDLSAQSQARRAVASEIKDHVEAAGKGFAARPEVLAGLQARVEAAGDPLLAQELAVAEDTMKWQAQARTAPPEALDAYAAALRDKMQKDGATPGGMARLELAEKMRDEAARELKADPLGWADRVGMPGIGPLDVANKGSVVQRIAAAEDVGERYGRRPQYLRPAEKKQLAEMAGQGGEQLLSVVGAITENFGDKAQMVLAELGQNAPTLAEIGRGMVMAGGRTAVAQDAAGGIALTRLKEYTPLLSSRATPGALKRAREWMLTATGNALASIPEANAAVQRVANYAFEARAARMGIADMGAAEAKDLYEQTVREVIGERRIGNATYGGVEMFGGKGVIIPPDVRQDKFRDLVNAIDVSDFGDAPPMISVKGKLQPVTNRELRQATLQQVDREGRYAFNIGTEDRPQWLAGRDGRAFLLDLGSLKPKLKSRVPGAYLDDIVRPALPPMKGALPSIDAKDDDDGEGAGP